MSTPQKDNTSIIKLIVSIAFLLVSLDLMAGPEGQFIEDFDGNSLIAGWLIEDRYLKDGSQYVLDFSFPTPPPGANGRALRVEYNKEAGWNKSWGWFQIQGLFNLMDYDNFSFRVFNQGSELKFNLRFEDIHSQVTETDWFLTGSEPGRIYTTTPEADWENLSVNYTKEAFANSPAIDWSKIRLIKFMVQPNNDTASGAFWLDDIRVTQTPGLGPIVDFECDTAGWEIGGIFSHDIVPLHTTGARPPIDSRHCLKIQWQNKPADYANIAYNSKHNPNAPEFRTGNYSLEKIYNGNNKVDIYLQSPTEAIIPVILKIGQTELWPEGNASGDHVARIDLRDGQWTRVRWTIPPSIVPNDGRYALYLLPHPAQADAGGILHMDDLFITGGRSRDIPDAPEISLDPINRKLNWNVISGAASYTVLKSVTADFKNSVAIHTTDTSLDIPASAGIDTETCYYRVAAENNSGTGFPSRPVKYNPLLTDHELIDFESKRCFDYFWQEADPTTGLIRAMVSDEGAAEHITHSMVRSAGYALAAYVIGAERGWVPYSKAQERADKLLDRLLKMQNDPDSSGFKDSMPLGVFLTRVEMNTGKRRLLADGGVSDDIWVSADLFGTALIVCGALTAGEYFGGITKTMAIDVYRNVRWLEFLDQNEERQRNPGETPVIMEKNYHRFQFYKLYYPEWSEYRKPEYPNPDLPFQGHWDSYDKQLLIYLLAAAAPDVDYRVDTANYPRVWDAFQKRLAPYKVVKDEQKRITQAKSQPLFYAWMNSLLSHQLSFAWFNLKDKLDRNGINWWVNSTIASKVNRGFCIDQAGKFSTYGPDAWGLTEAAEPFSHATRSYGSPPMKTDSFSLPLDDWRDTNRHNGTLAPMAAAGSIVFTPEESIAALKNYYSSYPELIGEYGFRDCYNANVNNADGAYLYGRYFDDKGDKDPANDHWIQGMPWYTDIWYSSDTSADNKGLTLLMLQNFKDGTVWNNLMQSDYIQDALLDLGFSDVGTGYTELAQGKTVAASSGTGAWHVVDGISSTKWESEDGVSHWITIDMGKAAMANTFIISHAGSGGEDQALNTRDFTIQISDDNEKWGAIEYVWYNTGNISTHILLNPVMARYYRIGITAAEQGGSGRARIYEVEIYNRDPYIDNKDELVARLANELAPEDPLVLEYLKAIQDNFSLERQLVPSMEDTQGQTFNNALTAMAFILKGERARAERILDFYSARTNQSNTDPDDQQFYLIEPENPDKTRRGFYQSIRLKAEGEKPAYSAHLTDRWMGDLVWLLIAYKYYEKEYGDNRYGNIANTIKDLMLEFYTDDPKGGPGGFVRHGWRWGPRDIRKKLERGEPITPEEREQLRNDAYCHEWDEDGYWIGHEELNIDCYAAFRLCEEEDPANKIKLWLDARMEELEQDPDISIPLDLYSWRAMAFVHEGQFYKDLAKIPDSDPSYRKVVLFKGKRALGFAPFADYLTQDAWLDGTGHVACAFFAAGDAGKGNFYANQYDSFIIERDILPIPPPAIDKTHGIPYLANNTLGGIDISKGFASTCSWYIFAKNRFNPLTLQINPSHSEVHLDIQAHHREAANYSGAACLKMVLDYQGANDYTQPDLHNYGVSHNSGNDLNFIDPRGMYKTLNSYELNPAYNYSCLSRATINHAYHDLCYWISYNVPNAYPPNMPAIIPTGGTYEGWVIVNGFRATANPQYANNYSVFGFWITDPAVSGIGQNIYLTADALASHFVPLTTSDGWEASYVTICEPPARQAEVTMESAKPFSRSFSGTREDIIASAIQGLKDNLLEYDITFSNAYKGSRPGSIIYVESNPGDFYGGFYIVTFLKEGGCSVAVTIDEHGLFKSASCVKEPDREYLQQFIKQKKRKLELSGTEKRGNSRQPRQFKNHFFPEPEQIQYIFY